MAVKYYLTFILVIDSTVNKTYNSHIHTTNEELKMMIQEIQKTLTDTYTYVTLSSGKKECYISYNHKDRLLNIVCLNASHKAFRGNGKFFKTFEDAIKNYKSSNMKNMIHYAESIANERQGVQQ